MKLEEIVKNMEDYVESESESIYKKMLSENSTAGELEDEASDLRWGRGNLNKKVYVPEFLNEFKDSINKEIRKRVYIKVTRTIHNIRLRETT